MNTPHGCELPPDLAQLIEVLSQSDEESINESINNFNVAAPPAAAEAQIVDMTQDERKPTHPPGKKTIVKAEYNKLMDELTNEALLINIADISQGEIKKAYDGWANLGYKKWADPGYKLKDMFRAGIKARAKEHAKKFEAGQESTPLEERCHCILKKMEKAEKAAAAKANEKKSQEKKRKQESAQEENLMGLLPKGKKPCTPTLLAALLRDGNFDEKNSASILSAYSNLAGKTTYPLPGKLQNCCSVRLNHTNVFVLVAIYIGEKAIEEEEALSGRGKERALATLAVGGEEITKYGPGEKPKEPRDDDPQTRIDNVFKSMTDDQTNVMKMIQNMQKSMGSLGGNLHQKESPNTKDRRIYKEYTDILISLYTERDAMKRAGLDTKSVEREIKEKEEQRAASKDREAAQGSATAQNLQDDMNAST